MRDPALIVEKLTPHIGAEVRASTVGPLDERTFKEVHDALIENGVIFFRDQHITPDQQKAFGRLLRRAGHAPGRAPALLEGHPEILVIHADEKSKHVAGENWHSDVSCDPEPPMGSILYMHELPPVGGDTLFASMYAAYEALSEPMKRMLERHDRDAQRRARLPRPLRRERRPGKIFPKAEHPVDPHAPRLRAQGALRQPRLHHAHRAAQAQRRATRVLRDALPSHRDAGVPVPLPLAGRTRWRSGTTAASQHHAMWDYFPQRRHGHRVTIKGDKPFYRAVIPVPLTSAGPPPGGRSRAAARRPGRARPTASAICR